MLGTQLRSALGIAFLGFVVGCDGESDWPSMDADGLQHVQTLSFGSTISNGDGFVGGSRQVDAITLAAKENAIAVHMGYSRSAYDFNDGKRLWQEGAVAVFEPQGGDWRQTRFLTELTDEGRSGARLGHRMVLEGDRLFASYGSAILVYDHVDGA